MKMESVSHCDERSLLAPQRQQIMSILQVTVFWVTAFFFLLFHPLPLCDTFTPSNESRSVKSQICIKSRDARKQQLDSAARWLAGDAFFALESVHHFFFLLPLKLHYLKCGVMTACALQVAHPH